MKQDDTCCWRAAEQGKDVCPVCGQVLGLYRLLADWAKANGIEPTERGKREKLYYQTKGRPKGVYN